MASTQTFGDRLRAMGTRPRDYVQKVTEGFWEDIKAELESYARKDIYKVVVDIHNDPGDTENWYVYVGGEFPKLAHINVLQSKYDINIIEFFGKDHDMCQRFAHIDFDHLEQIVTADGCTYHYISDDSFEISWWVN